MRLDITMGFVKVKGSKFGLAEFTPETRFTPTVNDCARAFGSGMKLDEFRFDNKNGAGVHIVFGFT